MTAFYRTLASFTISSWIMVTSEPSESTWFRGIAWGDARIAPKHLLLMLMLNSVRAGGN